MSATQIHIRIKEYTECLVQASARAELAAMNEIFGKVKQRVFNSNITKHGKDFGGYRSEAYKKKRESLGLQTFSKDLQFTEKINQDGPSLRRDFQLGVDEDNSVVYGFTTDRSNEIRGYQETSDKQIGEEIFYPNEDEIEFGINEYYHEIEKCQV